MSSVTANHSEVFALRSLDRETQGERYLRQHTVADILMLPEAIAASPKVICGEQFLSRPLRWVRLIELAYAHGPFHEGDLVLAFGPGLPDSAIEIAHYVNQMADQRIGCLMVELGSPSDHLSSAMVARCRERQIPLIALRTPAQLGRFAEAARSVVLGGQFELLERTVAAHERFTELALGDATVDELVAATVALSDADVIFSNLLHQIISMDTRKGSTERVLERWRLSTIAPIGSLGVEVDAEKHALIAPVVVRGRQRGWLTMLTDSTPNAVHSMLIEQAVVALSIRLRSETDEMLAATSSGNLLADILRGRYAGVEVMHARAAAAGHPTFGRSLLALAVHWNHEDVGGILRGALADTHLDGIVGEVGERGWGVLLIAQADVESRLKAYARRVHELCGTRTIERPILAAGPVVSDYADVRRAFTEAMEVSLVVESGGTATPSGQLDCYSIRDVQLRGLLSMMSEDPRVHSFAARTLQPLLVRDARDGDKSVHTLATYLRVGGNKSVAAERLQVSRQTLYERLARIQSLLDVDIDDPETSASLFAAIMFIESAPTRENGSNHTRGRTL
jgi:PucR family transcriptional regulator, purine catabolism regulatory protein